MKTTIVKRNRIKQDGNSNGKPVASSNNTSSTVKIKDDTAKVKVPKFKLRKTIATTLVIGMVIAVASCNSSSRKVENAKKEVLEAEQNLENANEEYQADIKRYRLETNKKVEKNNQHLAELKVLINSEKKEAKAEYEQQVAELERKNMLMKKRMDDYKADTKEDWQSFKSEFSKDMNELGIALKNFSTSNN